MRILLVEDEPRMRALVARGLSEADHRVESAGTGPEAIAAASAAEYDVLVVDVMLPGLSGIDVIRGLRAAGNRTPALMLTARDAPADVVAALDAGADDYLVKPFAFDVLLARLRALGRRAPIAQPVRLQVGDLALDVARHVVTRGGEEIALTRTEFTLLEVLLRRAGRVIPRTALIEHVWGDERPVESNTLDAFVKSLRQKVDHGDRPRLIQTIRGVGYTVRVEPAR